MSFLLFFRGLVLVLITFAVVTYFITHSWWATIVHTILCGILIQIGYFAAVLLLVWRSHGKKDADGRPGREPKIAEKNSTKAAASRLPNASRSRHP
ncbi:MAG TPA: exopolysaccharide production repressor protein [Rhizobiaceae bacterium]|jgi:exopolysaccharide production repressor protein|nr:exopolysaccharide production repressor protein [Rhizobiaceae bacterium]